MTPAGRVRAEAIELKARIAQARDLRDARQMLHAAKVEIGELKLEVERLGGKKVGA